MKHLKNPIWKMTYRGQGLYWHGDGYGDETRILAPSLSACKGIIDELRAKEVAQRPEHEQFWSQLPVAERDRIRRMVFDEAINPSGLSASELAFAFAKRAEFPRVFVRDCEETELLHICGDECRSNGCTERFK